MSTKTQPNVVTITTIGEPYRQERQAMTFPQVRRRVSWPSGLDVSGHNYPCGSIVTLASDRAHELEQSGHLQRGEPT